MARPESSPVVLVRGDEELLVDRAVRNAVQAARRSFDPDPVQVTDLDDPAAVGDALLDALSPSLFAEPSVVVVRSAQDVDPGLLQQLVDFAHDPAPAIRLVVVHDSKVKARKYADLLAAAEATVVRDCPKLKPGDRPGFVKAEFDLQGRPASDGAVRLLLQAVGNDLRELASAVQQLVVDTTGRVDEQLVAQYYSGRAEVTGFQVADKAVEGDARAALDLLRWARATGTPAPLVTSALADSLRTMGIVGGHRGGNAFALAKELGMPAWKIEKAQRQLHGWDPASLAAAVRAVARADAAVKGEERAVDYALERAVLTVARTGAT